MRTIRALTLALTFAFALGAGAIQYPQSSPQQTTPGQPGQAGAPDMNGQSNPSTAQQPSQPDQNQPGTAAHSQMPSIDEQVNALSSQLNLSAGQQVKARTILQNQMDQAMPIFNDATMSRDQKLQKIHSIRENTISQMRAILDSGQRDKFDQMVAAQDERVRQMQQQQEQNNSQPGNPAETGQPGSNPGSPDTGTPPSTGNPPSTPPANTPPTMPPGSTSPSRPPR